MMTIDNSKTVDTTALEQKIAKLDREIAGFDFDAPANLEAKANVESVLDDPAAFIASMDAESAKADWAIFRNYSARSELNGYVGTLAMDLMQCNSKFLITDTPTLQSPAGFSPESNVFVQTTIAVHVDNLRQIPRSNVKLYAHKMHRA